MIPFKVKKSVLYFIFWRYWKKIIIPPRYYISNIIRSFPVYPNNINFFTGDNNTVSVPYGRAGHTEDSRAKG